MRAVLAVALLLIASAWTQRLSAQEQLVDMSAATPLDRAAYSGQLDRVEHFLQVGAHPDNANGDGDTPLDYAIAGGYVKIADYLLAHGVDVNDSLSQAVRRDKGNVARYLLTHGADVNAKGKYGTPLIVTATLFDELDMVRLLLTHGADINAKTRSGMTALMAVSYMDLWDIAKTLLAHGADMNAQDKNGDTALILAAEHHDLDLVDALVTRGAEVNARNAEGWSALSYANGSARIYGIQGVSKDQEIAGYLRSHGAR